MFALDARGSGRMWRAPVVVRRASPPRAHRVDERREGASEIVGVEAVRLREKLANRAEITLDRARTEDQAGDVACAVDAVNEPSAAGAQPHRIVGEARDVGGEPLEEIVELGDDRRHVAERERRGEQRDELEIVKARPPRTRPMDERDRIARDAIDASGVRLELGENFGEPIGVRDRHGFRGNG